MTLKPATTQPLANAGTAVEHLTQCVRTHTRDARAKATRLAYTSDIALFSSGWCREYNLRREWIAPCSQGLEVNLLSSKTDQDGHGTQIIVEFGTDPGTCPVMIINRHLGARDQKGGDFSQDRSTR